MGRSTEFWICAALTLQVLVNAGWAVMYGWLARDYSGLRAWIAASIHLRPDDSPTTDSRTCGEIGNGSPDKLTKASAESGRE